MLTSSDLSWNYLGCMFWWHGIEQNNLVHTKSVPVVGKVCWKTIGTSEALTLQSILSSTRMTRIRVMVVFAFAVESRNTFSCSPLFIFVTVSSSVTRAFSIHV